MVEQAAHNRCVVGSNPASATSSTRVNFAHREGSGNLSPSITNEGVRPWQARARTYVQRSPWHALIAKSATTLQRRTAATIQTAWNLRSSVHAASLQLFTAKLANDQPRFGRAHLQRCKVNNYFAI